MERDSRRPSRRPADPRVDIGGIEFIQRQLVAMREAGKAILLVSVELDEIRALRPHSGDVRAAASSASARPTPTSAELGMLMAGLGEKAA